MPTSLPTVTYLFTDIEGSTNPAQEYPDRWEDLHTNHHATLQTALEAHNAHVIQSNVIAFCVALHTASDRLNAAIDIQRDLNRIKNNRHSRRVDRTPFANIKPGQGWKNT